MRGLLSWRGAIVFSVTVHLLLGLVFFLLPTEKKEKEKPFVTRLVNPDELKQIPEARANPPSASRPSPPVKPADSRIARPSVARPQRQPAQSSPPRQLPIPPSREESDRASGETDKSISQAQSPGSAPSGGQKDGEGLRSLPSQKPGDLGRTVPMPSVREKLFDREVVEKFAKREEQKSENTLTFHNEEFKYRTYMERLREKIEGIWKYPPDAAMRGIYGDLYIRFTIKKNGMLGDMELLRTSGHRSLDEAAQQALRDAQPFWPLPTEWGKDDLTITGHFVYSIYGTYIR